MRRGSHLVEYLVDFLSSSSLALLLGVVISVFGTRMVQGLLFETDPLNPAAFLGAAVFLGAIALTACVLPAWKAARVNPVEVLRKE